MKGAKTTLVSEDKKSTITNEDLWELIASFVKEKGLARFHIESYNNFIKYTLQQIVDEHKKIFRYETEIQSGEYIEFGKIRVGEPHIREAKGFEVKVLPSECRLRGLSYVAPLYLEVSYKNTKKEVYIGDIPVMVKSDICYLSKMSEKELIEAGEDPNDLGGYFIINGSERVIIAQEDLVENRILVDLVEKGQSAVYVAKVISSIPGQRIPVSVERHKDGSLYVIFPAVPTKLPLFIVLRALGMENDKDIFDALSIGDPKIDEELFIAYLQSEKVQTREDALEYIGNRIAHGRPREKRKEAAENILCRYLLPHLGITKESNLNKAYYLTQMAKAVIEAVHEIRPLDDKDHYKNKRIKLAGEMLAVLFRSAFRAFCNDVIKQFQRRRSGGEIHDITTLIRSDIITEKMLYALATGNWVGGKTGVSQLLDRTNYLSTLSHLRRVISPLSRTQPHYEARDLHPTQWGRLCPVETPEGPNCGLVKNLALLAIVSRGCDREEIRNKLLTELKVNPDIIKGIKGAKVYLDGELIGEHPNGEKLVETIRKMRRNKQIDWQVNVAIYKRGTSVEVYINTDPSRILRPLLIVENGKLKLTKDHIEKVKKGLLCWSDLIGNVIEYLDAEEEENAYIAISLDTITKEHTHCEFPAASLFGVVASVIPYSNHNHSPRNTFEGAMGKQALGFSYSNIFKRADSRGHLLHYPQIPLVYTKPMKVTGVMKRPFGQNMVVAVLSYTGYNIQDAVIINKSAVDRGLARSTFFRLYEAEEHRYPGGTYDSIEVPKPGIKGYYAQEFYSKLEEDGIVMPEVEVKGGEVIIGRTSPPRFLEEFKEIETYSRRDTSVLLRHGEKGIVDNVILTNTVDGNVLIRVRVRDHRIPEIGDKFASRHGQKGVIGILLNHEDMPFTEDGIVPDLIINPHAIPSRMTVGQLLESIAGKYAALSCNFIDGTPFEGTPEDFIRKELEKYGFKSTGKEVMYNGITGEKMVAEVFIGIVYYQKLHHMVSDKIHARTRGPVQILTRQPTEGRAREGGLRIGEMERDCLIAYGASSILQDLLLDLSDPTIVYVCRKCNSLSYFDERKNITVCPLCGPHINIVKVKISYAFKLLLQELISMCIYPRLIVEEKIKI